MKLYLDNISELLDCEGGAGGVVCYSAQFTDEAFSLHRKKHASLGITIYYNTSRLDLYLHCHYFLLVG